MSTRDDSKRRKVFLVDDHPIIRRGSAFVINQEKDLEVCGEAEDAAGALKGVEQTCPDIVVVDLALKMSSGLDLIKDLRIRCPEVPVLALSMHDEGFHAERVIRAGARGYIMKEEATENLLQAIRQVLDGQIYLSEAMARRLLSKIAGHPMAGQSQPTDALSDREMQVYELIGQGFQTRQIAQRLHLSVKTVDTHRENIKRKLGLENATELLQHAIKFVHLQHDHE